MINIIFFRNIPVLIVKKKSSSLTPIKSSITKCQANLHAENNSINNMPTMRSQSKVCSVPGDASLSSESTVLGQLGQHLLPRLSPACWLLLVSGETGTQAHCLGWLTGVQQWVRMVSRTWLPAEDDSMGVEGQGHVAGGVAPGGGRNKSRSRSKSTSRSRSKSRSRSTSRMYR